ncbi:TetR/AcrR family transcriptional regulator [Amantichitinum ursilacus]|uniref:HTH-type transcriptional repressor ComR n=1 Tax=Amantichitinum ursilacus TaxID=857265 RepID=A0A0N0XM49_9NEIS|nr:TetR/AcrR family transcriptional regulator [Amantichitinum ursilacus]KPC53879.1 HTH-type transcriptional repressor ComR [Amantichitinum ursilacus]
MAERGRPRCFDREAALRSAMTIFWRYGYEGSSLAQLTEAMGINSPSLYSSFGSKQGLFREAVDQYDAEEGATIREALDARADVREAIQHMLHTSAQCFSVPGKPAGCMVLLAATNCTPENAGIWEYMSDRRKRSTAILQARLDRGIADGQIAASVDTEKLAAFFGGIRNGMSIHARDGACRDLLMAMADAAMAGWDQLTAAPVLTS